MSKWSNGSQNREDRSKGKLEPCQVQLLSVVPQDQNPGGAKGINHRDRPLKGETDCQQDGGHSGSNRRRIKSSYCAVTEHNWQNPKSQPTAWQANITYAIPREPGEEAHLQTAGREKVDRTGILEQFLQLWTCFRPRAKHHSLNRLRHLRVVLQPLLQNVREPVPHGERNCHKWICFIVGRDLSRKSAKSTKAQVNILPRQIRAVIKFTWIHRSRRE